MVRPSKGRTFEKVMRGGRVGKMAEKNIRAKRNPKKKFMQKKGGILMLRKFCPTVIGCYYWNAIPLSIREKTTKKLFKRALFKYYLAQY